LKPGINTSISFRGSDYIRDRSVLIVRDVWSYYCTLNEEGEASIEAHFRTKPKAVERLTGLPSAPVTMEAGTHSIKLLTV
jgi:hypothetical protein